jgi:hypothetical protein
VKFFIPKKIEGRRDYEQRSSSGEMNLKVILVPIVCRLIFRADIQSRPLLAPRWIVSRISMSSCLSSSTQFNLLLLLLLLLPVPKSHIICLFHPFDTDLEIITEAHPVTRASTQKNKVRTKDPLTPSDGTTADEESPPLSKSHTLPTLPTLSTNPGPFFLPSYSTCIALQQ